MSGDSTLTVTQLADPAKGGGRSLGGKVITRLPSPVKTLAALDYNTLFATDGNNLHRIEVINFLNSPNSVTSSVVARGGWTDRLVYDGHLHLYGLTDGQLRRYALSSSYGITGNTLLGERGWIFATPTGVDDEWLVGTTVNGELVSYDLNPDAPVQPAALDVDVQEPGQPWWRRVLRAEGGRRPVALRRPGSERRQRHRHRPRQADRNRWLVPAPAHRPAPRVHLSPNGT